MDFCRFRNTASCSIGTFNLLENYVKIGLIKQANGKYFTFFWHLLHNITKRFNVFKMLIAFHVKKTFIIEEDR